MVCASFLGVGAEGYWVSDLVISGYENDQEMLDEMSFGLSFCILDASGRTLKTKNSYFSYDDTSDDCETWNGGVWSDFQSQEILETGSENDFLLMPGDAIWLSAPFASDGFQYSITTKGGIIEDNISFDLRAGGNAIGNPMHFPFWVSEMIISGYEKDQELLDEMSFGLGFYILDANGRTLKNENRYFSYDDTSDDCETWNGGIWSDYKGSEILSHGASNDYQLKIGEGIWLSMSVPSEGFTYSVIFPIKGK